MQQASDKSIIISEILDSRTRNLVSVTRISDYVLSNELVSMALAMVAEDKQINRVLEELFAEEVLFIIALEFLPSLQLLTSLLGRKIWTAVVFFPSILSHCQINMNCDIHLLQTI